MQNIAEAKLRESMIARAKAVAAELIGTCMTRLEDISSEEERNNRHFCEALDEECFQCGGCGWWCGEDESHEADDGPLCNDCATEDAEDAEDAEDRVRPCDGAHVGEACADPDCWRLWQDDEDEDDDYPEHGELSGDYDE